MVRSSISNAFGSCLAAVLTLRLLFCRLCRGGKGLCGATKSSAMMLEPVLGCGCVRPLTQVLHHQQAMRTS